MINKILRNNYFVLLAVFIVVVIVMSNLSEYFLTGDYLLSASRFIAEKSLIGLGMTLVIFVGGIDLSVGSMMALASVILGLLCSAIPGWVSVIIVLGLGLCVGFFNGILVCKLKLPALIITLAMMEFLRGVALGLSGGSAISVQGDILFLGQGGVGSVPIQPIIVTAAYAIVAVIIYRSNFGIYCKAIGFNEKVARFSGVRVDKNKIICYMLSGMFAALLGIMFTCRVGSARADYGDSYEMDAITIAVFGGASLAGGKVSFLGSYIAAIIITLIRLGLTTAAVQTEIQSVIVGIILICTVVLNNFVLSKEKEL